MQPQEGNKLIAEFLGWVFHTKEYNWKRSRIDYPTWSDGAMGWKELHFHTSWDWLMPVVERIENLACVGAVVISRDHCWISDDKEPADNQNIVPADLCRKSKINAVWNAVVRFIQWYNSQTLKPISNE
jgi:hypothetical protein